MMGQGIFFNFFKKPQVRASSFYAFKKT